LAANLESRLDRLSVGYSGTAYRKNEQGDYVTHLFASTEQTLCLLGTVLGFSFDKSHTMRRDDLSASRTCSFTRLRAMRFGGARRHGLAGRRIPLQPDATTHILHRRERQPTVR
jgi:hypothetical protein